MADATCGNCPGVMPAARFTVEWDPFVGFNVLGADGRLVKSWERQADAFGHAERLLDAEIPGGETLLACSECPFLSVGR